MRSSANGARRRLVRRRLCKRMVCRVYRKQRAYLVLCGKYSRIEDSVRGSGCGDHGGYSGRYVVDRMPLPAPLHYSPKYSRILSMRSPCLTWNGHRESQCPQWIQSPAFLSSAAGHGWQWLQYTQVPSTSFGTNVPRTE